MHARVRTLDNRRYGYLFILPFAIFFLVFNVYPIGYSFFLSLQKWNGFSKMSFIGFGQYLNLVRDPRFWGDLLNTFYLFIINVPLIVVLSLVGATILDSRSLPLKNLFMSIYLFPYFVPLVVVSVIFGLMMSTHYGILNQILGLVGIPHVPWLDSRHWSKNAILVALLWRWVGYWTLVQLAGLQSIDKNLYEAAIIDGAGKVRMFTSITIPLMRPILLFVFVLNSIGTLQAFDTPYILTNGGPLQSSETSVMYIYYFGFTYFKLGQAAAASWLVFVVILVVSLLQLRAGRGGDERSS